MPKRNALHIPVHKGGKRRYFRAACCNGYGTNREGTEVALRVRVTFGENGVMGRIGWGESKGGGSCNAMLQLVVGESVRALAP